MARTAATPLEQLVDTAGQTQLVVDIVQLVGCGHAFVNQMGPPNRKARDDKGLVLDNLVVASAEQRGIMVQLRLTFSNSAA